MKVSLKSLVVQRHYYISVINRDILESRQLGPFVLKRCLLEISTLNQFLRQSHLSAIVIIYFFDKYKIIYRSFLFFFHDTNNFYDKFWICKIQLAYCKCETVSFTNFSFSKKIWLSYFNRFSKAEINWWLRLRGPKFTSGPERRCYGFG